LTLKKVGILDTTLTDEWSGQTLNLKRSPILGSNNKLKLDYRMQIEKDGTRSSKNIIMKSLKHFFFFF